MQPKDGGEPGRIDVDRKNEGREQGFTENIPHSIQRVKYIRTLPDDQKGERGMGQAPSSQQLLLELIKYESLSSWFTDVRKD